MRNITGLIKNRGAVTKLAHVRKIAGKRVHLKYCHIL